MRYCHPIQQGFKEK